MEVIQGEVSEEILAELNRILQAAARAGGAASADPSGVLAKLAKFMSGKDVPKPGSQGTYAVGASSYSEGVMTMGTVGTASFGSAMENEAKMDFSVSQEDLGQRESCVHGEIGLITAFPGFQAVLATQDCCLFCYGLLESRGYAHQKLRAAVWPQTGWTHDYMGFTLKRVNLAINPKGNLVAITWGSQTVYYRVDVG